MSAALHTPGPWHRNVPPASKYTVVWSGGNKHVARVIVDGLTAEEVEANIALIAAAPDLLALAVRTLQWTVAVEQDQMVRGERGEHSLFVDDLRAAIVKATGSARATQ